ncbi:MAG: hypothetical protein ACE5JU_00820 [Candidatus Binatia bacterium]
MAFDLKLSVRKEINQLKRDIGRASSQLASLKDELRRREKVYDLLAVERGRKRATRERGRKSAVVDWNSVLKGLPSTFTIDNIARKNAVKRKPRAYLRQVLVRWVKEGKAKRTGRGKYQRV